MRAPIPALAALLLVACDTGDKAVVIPTFGPPEVTTGFYSGPDCDQDNPDWTVGLLRCTPDASAGYTLFAPMNWPETFLLDIHGQLVHLWTGSATPGASVYLEPNGHLLRTERIPAEGPFMAGGAGGRIVELDWDSEVVWEFEYNGPDHLLHHDVERLPDGNVLAIAWESISFEEAVALGRDPGTVTIQDGMWAVHVIEIDPATDAIVWEWHILDHVIQDLDPSAPNYGVLADNPHRVDINRQWGAFASLPADWNHVNGIDYNAELDQIVLSAHNQDELWVIDHRTGDIVYRWGDPGNYGHDEPQVFSGQHDVEWIPEGHPGEGNLLVFNNGNAFGASAVVEIEPPVLPDGSYLLEAGQPYGPVAPTWEYRDGPEFFSSFISGSQRLPNGNTLICEGDQGYLFEVTPQGEIVWEYIVPIDILGPVEQGVEWPAGVVLNATFRADRYPADFPAFQGRDLEPIGWIQLDE